MEKLHSSHGIKTTSTKFQVAFKDTIERHTNLQIRDNWKQFDTDY